MSRRDEQSHPGKTARRRIIEDAEIRCYEKRRDLRQEQLLRDGNVPRETRLALQEAVINYYYALFPLRNEDPVDEWWDSVTLSDEWTTEQTVTTRQIVGTRSMYGKARVETREDTVEQPVEGLDTLQQVEAQTVERENEIQDAKGERTETERFQVILPAEVLVDISLVLDEAVNRLGMGPAVEEELPTDEI